MHCHFCKCELPQEGFSHVIFAKGFLHRADPDMPDYPVCGRCLKYHGLSMSKLVSRSKLARERTLREPKIFPAGGSEP